MELLVAFITLHLYETEKITPLFDSVCG